MAELTFLLDAATGGLLVERPDRGPSELRNNLEHLLGSGQAIACAAPRTMLTLPSAQAEEAAGGPCVRLAGYWHGSLIEGPGRRSTAKFQGCAIRCEGCLTPESWDPAGGLLDPAFERDGVTILGGEPFGQPDGLLALVRTLRARGCGHILCYSGYTYGALRRRAERQPSIAAVLDEIDILIDGPYVAALADGASPWTGSRNQRVLALKGAVPAQGSAAGTVPVAHLREVMGAIQQMAAADHRLPGDSRAGEPSAVP
ncbi:MAG: 4Fe-4S single cluster domain-containing protein [Hyphomicrobiales bacterium]